MGTLRARKDGEIQARRNEILDAAATLFTERDWGTLTLAMIAEKTSISRPSMYNYYRSVEEVYFDLAAREYAAWGAELPRIFERPMTREEFCASLTESLFSRPLLLKLMHLYVDIGEEKCGGDLLERYRASVHAFYKEFFRIIESQFPQSPASEQRRFAIQFTRYTVTLYGLTRIPKTALEAMQGWGTFGTIPDAREICLDALMLLSGGLAFSPHK